MEKILPNKTPMPPLGNRGLFVPLEFWLDVIAYLDKRVEIVSVGSGYGVVEMNVKLQRGKICEVGFSEKVRVREIVEKAGSRGTPNPSQLSSSPNESDPAV